MPQSSGEKVIEVSVDDDLLISTSLRLLSVTTRSFSVGVAADHVSMLFAIFPYLTWPQSISEFSQSLNQAVKISLSEERMTEQTRARRDWAAAAGTRLGPHPHYIRVWRKYANQPCCKKRTAVSKDAH
jgi:hypothetical protein